MIEYQNFQMTRLRKTTRTALLGFNWDIIPDGFEEAADGRISLLAGGGNVQLRETPNTTITWSVLNDDLSVASSFTFDNAGGPAFSSGFHDLNFRPVSFNASTNQFVSDTPEGVPHLWGITGGSATWINTYRPDSSAAYTYPTPAGWASTDSTVGYYYSSQWMRPGGIYYLVNQNLAGYQWELHRYPANMIQGDYIEIVPGTRWGSDSPVSASARIELEDSATDVSSINRYLLYVNPQGSSAWTLSLSGAANPHQLIQYNATLSVMSTVDVSALTVPLGSAAVMFAVQGDLLFIGTANGQFAVFSIEQGAKLADADLELSAGATVQHQARMMPHPDGTLYVQYITGIGSTSLVKHFAIYKYADPFEINCGCVGLDQIVYELATRAGIPASRIDVSQIAESETYPCVIGFGIGRPTSSRTMIEILQRYGFFDVTEQGGTVTALRRNRDPDGTIGGDDLRAHAYGEEPKTLCERERTEDYEIPLEVRVEFSQEDAEYEPGSEAYARRVTDASGVLDIDLTAVAMTPTRAAGIAESTMLEAIVARETLKFSLVATAANKALKPGDIKTLDVNGREEVVRLIDVSYSFPGVQEWTALRHDPAVYSTDALGTSRRTSGSVIFAPGQTTYELLDAPLVREFDDAAGYFAAMGGNQSFAGIIDGWPGADLIRTGPSGDEDILRLLRPPSLFGTTSGALGDASPAVIDYTPLTVTTTAAFESATLQEALFGKNLAAVEVRSGGSRIGWELVRFLDVVNNDGSVTITGLIRGVNGTEWATGLHQSGDRFVVLDSLGQILTDLDTELNFTWTHRALTIGGNIFNEANATSFTYTGVDRKPYAPCLLKATRGADSPVTDDVVLSWTRRDRFGRELQSGQTLPLSESSEAYEVDIYDTDGTTVLRTLSVSDATATYTAAQQAADFGSPLPATLDVAVYQIGELGRGYAARETLTITEA